MKRFQKVKKGDEMSKTVTIKDVARKANVGLGTVSRVLNNHASVKESTRISVLNAIKELDYNPNAIARSLKSKSTKSVGVMIPDISSAFYPDIVRGIEDVASIYKYNIILCNTDLDREREKSSLNMLKEKKVDGIIFISNTIDEELKKEFKKIGIPIVLVATKDLNNEFHSVVIDNVKASYTAVDFLCQLGHKNIAMIAGTYGDPNAGIPRVEGYRRALEDNGIEVQEDLIYYGDYKYKSGYELMKRILERKVIPTALFAASDNMAIGAASAALQSGYKIPEDISIIGFDGIETAEFFYPPISTVKQPRYDMGARGMEQLIRLIRNEPLEDFEVVLDHQLTLRDSHKSI